MCKPTLSTLSGISHTLPALPVPTRTSAFQRCISLQCSQPFNLAWLLTRTWGVRRHCLPARPPTAARVPGKSRDSENRSVSQDTPLPSETGMEVQRQWAWNGWMDSEFTSAVWNLLPECRYSCDSHSQVSSLHPCVLLITPLATESMILHSGTAATCTGTQLLEEGWGSN